MARGRREGVGPHGDGQRGVNEDICNSVNNKNKAKKESTNEYTDKGNNTLMSLSLSPSPCPTPILSKENQ